MLGGDFHARTALVDRVFPVQVVDLQLHELGLRMRGDDLVEFLGGAVVREADVADESFFLHLRHEVPHAQLVENCRAGAAGHVQQVEVEVACARALERLAELLLRVFGRLAADPRDALRGELVALARMALHECACDFVLAAGVDPRGVEVREPGVEKAVDHLADQLVVEAAVLEARQAHEAESEFADVLA